jgi:glycosyltransferase involved in cell wall biosynthesis
MTAMNQPPISCVVPTLNSAATLDATLLSLHAQQNIHPEIIVADSGSADGTLDICRRWGVQTIYVPPGNMYRAINAGLRKCSGEWFAYLNSDDWIYPDSFARLLSRGEQAQAGAVYGNCDYADEQGRFVYSFAAAEPDELMPLFRLRQMAFAQQAAIFRRRAYEQLGGFDESLHYRADADFYIRALLARMSFAKLHGPSVACFRLHAKQFSNQGTQQTELEADRIFGREELKASLGDKLKLASWRFRNLPHYAIRILRESLLTNRIRLPRAIETYTHK